jgi:hypothetical protein
VCQKSADPKRQRFPNTGGWQRSSLSALRGGRPGGNPCSLAEISLFLITGNLSLWLGKGLGISALDPPGGSSFEGFPCIFPVDQGNVSRDEFAPDCLHRHLVCRCRDFPRALRNCLRNLRDSAGSWPLGPGRSEPETAGSGPGIQRGPCLSLLAIGRFGFAADSPTESSDPSTSPAI